MPTQAQSAPLIQGIQSPDVIVNPTLFYGATRRQRYAMRGLTAFAGIGATDQVQLRQSGIVAGLEVRVQGTVTFAGALGATAMTYDWPLNIVRAFRLSANGQSNLINASGLMVRAHEFIDNPKIQDQGRTQNVAAAAETEGTLSLGHDDWGTNAAGNLGPGVAPAALGAHTFDLTYFVPVAAHQVSLIGAVYAQSSATNLTLEIQWNTEAGVCTVAAGCTLTWAVNYSVTGVVYTIPNVNGSYVIPDLSQFHQLAQFRQNGIGAGTNEILLPGTGVGRNLLRVMHNAYSTGIPLRQTDANINAAGWGYGGNQIPERYDSGQPFRAMNERLTGCDIGGGVWGIGIWDFASENALRDVVDESTTSDLRVLLGLVAAPVGGFAEVCQETLFAAPVGA